MCRADGATTRRSKWLWETWDITGVQLAAYKGVGANVGVRDDHNGKKALGAMHLQIDVASASAVIHKDVQALELKQQLLSAIQGHTASSSRLGAGGRG